MYHALDALVDQPEIRLITTRHEQATTYMADGYSRVGGGIGTALMVPGPGLLNAASGMSTAFSASSPILVVSGQVERDLIGSDRGSSTRSTTRLTPSGPLPSGPSAFWTRLRYPRWCTRRSDS